MVRNFARAVCGFTLTILSLSAGSLAANDAVLNEFYGTGVHQFFAGNYAQAMVDLTAAIDGGSKDPRAYYFRALSELKIGQQAAAQADLSKGAALESADINQFYPVAKSLERIQGSSRLTLERYRALARAEAYQRQERRNTVRYEQRRRAEGQVLRSPDFAPPPTKASAVAPIVPAPPKPGPAVPADEDPFAEKEQPAAPETATPAEEMPVEEAPAADAPADDPFGDPPAKEPAVEEAGEDAKDAAPPAKAEDDPFGDDKEPAKPADDAKGTEAPPAAEPAEEDPFK